MKVITMRKCVNINMINKWKKKQFDNTSTLSNFYNLRKFICTFRSHFWIILNKKYKNVNRSNQYILNSETRTDPSQIFIAVSSQKMPVKWRNWNQTNKKIKKINGCKPRKLTGKSKKRTHVKKQTLNIKL